MFLLFCLPVLVRINNASYSDKQPPNLRGSTQQTCMSRARNVWCWSPPTGGTSLPSGASHVGFQSHWRRCGQAHHFCHGQVVWTSHHFCFIGQTNHRTETELQRKLGNVARGEGHRIWQTPKICSATVLGVNFLAYWIMIRIRFCVVSNGLDFRQTMWTAALSSLRVPSFRIAESPLPPSILIEGSYEWALRICVLLAPGKYDGLVSWTHRSQT